MTGTSYTVSGLECATTHDFRVGAYGDGTTYNARAGLWSPTATSTTATCAPRAPEFESSSYEFDVSVVATAGDSVGTVSATDVNDDPITYSITAGNTAGKFDIATSTGEIMVTGPLGSVVGATSTLTVGASDGVSGTATVPVTVTVVAVDCSVGTAVASPGSEPGLVSDCETLLSLCDALSGTATLNWSLDTPIASWDGVTVGGTPQRVTGLVLDSRGLTGELPAGLGLPIGLEELRLTFNSQLTGQIPVQLADLVNLRKLHLRDNGLTGPIPPELGRLSKLTELWLSWNRLSGEIPPELVMLQALSELELDYNSLSGAVPWELGSIRRLRVLRLSRNRLEGCIRPSLRNVRANDLSRLRLADCPQAGRVPAPGGLGVSLSVGTFTATWGAVSGAGLYELQYRTGDAAVEWAGVGTTKTATLAYTPADGTACGTTYDFRVRSFGDASTYAAGWSLESGVESVTTAACNHAPEFATSTYSFTVAEDATTGSTVGTVSASDPDDELLSYAITAGNAAGQFAVVTSTGAVTVAAALDHETVSSYTLTLEARDDRDGVATATVEIVVTDVLKDTPPAPGGLGVSLTDGTFAVTWSTVAGASVYEVQQQVSGLVAGWALVATTTGLSATYSPVGGTECGTTYEFRVRAYGEGTTYVADWGQPSQPEPYETVACNRPPEFATSTYSFMVAEDATATDAVVVAGPSAWGRSRDGRGLGLGGRQVDSLDDARADLPRPGDETGLEGLGKHGFDLGRIRNDHRLVVRAAL